MKKRKRKSVLARSRFRTIREANQLVEDNIGLAWKFVILKKKQVRYFRIHHDVIESIAMMGLFAASRKWNPEKSRLSTFAFLCMNTELRHWFKQRRNKADRVQRAPIPDKWYNRPEDTREKPAANGVDATHDLAFAMEGLTAQERFVLTERTVKGFKLREVGDALGVTRERVRQIEVQALKKCRERLEAAA